MSSPAPIVAKSEIFAQTEWNQLYPAKEFKEKQAAKTVGLIALHYLLALNQPDNLIIPYVEKIKDSKILTYADPNHYGLTPLIIATMRGRFAVIQTVIEKLQAGERKNVIHQVDHYGWSALHHAVLTSETIYHYILKHGGDLTLRTKADGTCEDIARLTKKENSGYSSLKTTLISPNGTHYSLSSLTPTQLKDLTTMECYRDDPYYPSFSWKKLWQQEENSQDVAATKRVYTQFIKKPPILIVSPSSQLKDKTASFELVAGQNLEEGDCIFEYSGEVVPVRKDLSVAESMAYPAQDYLLNSLDAKRVGNVARFSNCGWPNASINKVIANGTVRWVFTALEDIKQGTPIQWDYGIEVFSLTLVKQVIFNRAEIRKYFGKSLKQVIKDAEKSGNVHRLLFPINAPAVLLDLHFSSIVKAKEWFHVLFENSPAPIFRGWLSTYNDGKIIITSLLKRLSESDEKLSKYPRINTAVNEWILASIGHMTLMQLMKGLELIAEDLKIIDSPLHTSFDGKYKEDLEAKLHSYEWEKDENAPLGFKRSCEDILATMIHLPDLVLIHHYIPQYEAVQKTLDPTKEAYQSNAYVLERLRQKVSKTMDQGEMVRNLLAFQASKEEKKLGEKSK